MAKRTAVLVVGVALALSLPLSSGGSPGASAGIARACSARAARLVILSSDVPNRVKIDASGRFRGAGIDRLICRDLTGDGRSDMVATVVTGGTAGTEAWLAFVRVHRAWKLVFRRLHLYKALVRAASKGVVETLPVYKANDPNCCPTGGFDHTLFRWRHGRFAAIRAWHSSSP